MRRLCSPVCACSLMLSAAIATPVLAQVAQTPPSAQPVPAQGPPEPPAVGHQPAIPPPQPPGVEVRSERPYLGLFAGGEGAPPPEGLSLLADGYGGRDTNVLAAQHGGPTNPFANVGGNYVGGTGTANYLWVRRRSLFAATGSADLRRYPTLEVPLFQSYAASVNGQFGIGRRLTADLRQDAYRSTFYQLDFGPRIGLAPSQQPLTAPPTLDRGLSESAAYGFVSAATMTQSLNARSTLEYGYVRRQTHYQSDDHEFLLNRGEVAYRRGMTRYATLRLGYGYQKADYGGTGLPVTLQNIDVGVEYGRPLSFSRRTRVTFSMGSSVLSREAITFYRVGGTADLVHEIGRTWELGASYIRGMQFTDLVPEPLYVDTVAAHARGLAGRRTLLRFGGDYATGVLTLSARSRGLRSYGGIAEFLFGLNEQVAFYGDYRYYHYAINSGVVVLPGVPHDADRQSVRGGIRVWLPVMTHRRRGSQ